MLDPAKYRMFRYIRLNSGGSWIQDFPKESLTNLGSWTLDPAEYRMFGYIRLYSGGIEKSGCSMDM